MALRWSHGFHSSPPISRSVCRVSPLPCLHLSTRTRSHLPSISLRACSAAVSDGVEPRRLQTSSQAAKLKEELYKAMEEAQQGLDEKCLGIIASLEELRHVPDIATQPDVLKGRLVGLKVKFRENRMDGKQRYLHFEGSPTTLGASTFNALKPSDQKIVLYTSYQDVSVDRPDSYTLLTDVDVENPLGGDPLPGQIANRGRFSVQGSHSLDVEFLSVEIKPRFPERDLSVWFRVFKEANPDMDENGIVSVHHPKPIKGRTDILYMDDEIRIHRGHKGGVSVLRLLKDPL